MIEAFGDPASGLPEVLHATAAAEDTSFDRFYRGHRDEIASALGFAVGNLELGAEAADEAMVRALARWPIVRGHANPAGWVYRVGLNWARSALRRRRETSSAFLDHAGTDLAAKDPALDRALAALPLKYRAVVVCRFLLDWTVEDTAVALGISPGTVKSRLHRALARLRADVKER